MSQARLILSPLLACAIYLLTPSELPAQWSFMADEEQLPRKVIVDAGEVSRESTSRLVYDPVYEIERYETIEYLKYNGSIWVCLEPTTLSSVHSTEAALLLADGQENFYIAVIESRIGNIDVTVERAYEVACP